MMRQLRTNNTFHHLFGKALESYVLFPLSALLMLGIIWLATSHLISVEGSTAERNAAASARELVETYEAQMTSGPSTIRSRWSLMSLKVRASPCLWKN